MNSAPIQPTGLATILLRRGLVADPEARHYRAMRQAVWLYLYLLLAVNPTTGARLLSPAQIATQMGLNEETIRSWLGRLRKAGYLRVERQGDYLRVEMKRWQAPVRPAVPATADPKPPVAKPRSGMTAELLARRLGEEPGDPFWEHAVETWDQTTIRRVLDEVERVPAEQIRKSRAALFRYIITRIDTSNQ
jgi:DNA-binding transcriptional ArsR family regulator